MKKMWVLLLIVFLAPTSFASKDKKTKKENSASAVKVARKIAQVESETPQAAVFAGFLGCRAHLAGATAEFASCVAPRTVDAAARKRELLRFLASPVEISRIRDCREADLERAKGFSDATEHVVCFDYHDGIRKGAGLAYFLKHQGKFRVFSLQSLPDL
ncbi:MAG TPA: hypothetical protein PL182_04800 [Pseudobdellovibrionaceae bacterium]|nr:hypothetical protein [Pseudobdellovibrionaceae bacterium]